MHIPGEVKFLVCVDSSDECKAALEESLLFDEGSIKSIEMGMLAIYTNATNAASRVNNFPNGNSNFPLYFVQNP